MTDEEKALALKVGPRLRAVMAEFRMPNVETLADLAQAQRGAASNWINCYNLPPVWRMIALCSATELTLDWIYRGEGRGMPSERVAALNRLARAAEATPTDAPAKKRGRPAKKLAPVPVSQAPERPASVQSKARARAKATVS